MWDDFGNGSDGDANKSNGDEGGDDWADFAEADTTPAQEEQKAEA